MRRTQGPSSGCGVGHGLALRAQEREVLRQAHELRPAAAAARRGPRQSRGCARRRSSTSSARLRRPRSARPRSSASSVALRRAAQAVRAARRRPRGGACSRWPRPGGSPTRTARRRGHSAHSGRRASQTLRPWKISEVGGPGPALARHERHQLLLDLERVVARRRARAGSTRAARGCRPRCPRRRRRRGRARRSPSCGRRRQRHQLGHRARAPRRRGARRSPARSR